MPFTIIKDDITNIEVDAIVNSTSSTGEIPGGAEASIFEESGPDLHQARLEIGTLEVTQAMLTKGYNLLSKYVIHVLGPKYENESDDLLQLKDTYDNVLQVARSAKCRSIAFPLISTGFFGYPKKTALKVAEDVIMDFLSKEEMDIYLVVYDDESYLSSLELYNDVSEYIDDNLIYEKELRTSDAYYSFDSLEEVEKLENRLTNIDEGFSNTLMKLVEDSKEKSFAIYTRANVDKKLFSKIKNNRDYHPSKNVAVAFAIALRLNLEETKDFIERAGYTLSKSMVFDVIIEYCITHNIYDIFTINEILYDKDQALLGSKMLE